MNTVFYKVIFKALKEDEDFTFSLTFRNLVASKPISLPSHYFPTLKELSKEDKSIINFQNIQEVIKIGDDNFNFVFAYYIVLLFTYIDNKKKQGFLVGNAKNYGDILIGIWPFNQEDFKYESGIVYKIFNNLINKHNFEKICIIYS